MKECSENTCKGKWCEDERAGGGGGVETMVYLNGNRTLCHFKFPTFLCNSHKTLKI
jgi:hypothetical protein